MRSILEKRLESLALEQKKGRQALAELDEKRARLTETLLRIEGAASVLRELQAAESCGPVGMADDGSVHAEFLHQVPC